MDINLSLFTVRKLATVFLAVGICLFFVLFFPISEVFAGKWKLQQQIELFQIESIQIWQWQTPIGTISVRYYALCMLLGILAGYALCLFLSKIHYIASTVIDRLLIGLIVFGLIGARLFFVAFHWEQFFNNPLSILLNLPQGGLAFFGAILGGGGYVWLYCRRFRFNFWEFADFLAPSLLLGQILGRFGNFFNYESYGPPTSVFWKMYVPETVNFYEDLNQKYFHPTFLYEIIPNFLLLIIILFFYEKLTHKHAGIILAMYAFGYGFIRFCTEFLRLDALTISLPNALVLGPFTFEKILISQISALILCLGGVFIYFSRNKVIYLKKTMSEYFV